MAVGQPELDLTEFLPAPRKCVVVSRLEQLNDEDRAKFEAALTLPNVSNVKIAERFGERGIRVTVDSLSKHRGNECICGR